MTMVKPVLKRIMIIVLAALVALIITAFLLSCEGVVFGNLQVEFDDKNEKIVIHWSDPEWEIYYSVRPEDGEWSDEEKYFSSIKYRSLHLAPGTYEFKAAAKVDEDIVTETIEEYEKSSLLTDEYRALTTYKLNKETEKYEQAKKYHYDIEYAVNVREKDNSKVSISAVKESWPDFPVLLGESGGVVGVGIEPGREVTALKMKDALSALDVSSENGGYLLSVDFYSETDSLYSTPRFYIEEDGIIKDHFDFPEAFESSGYFQLLYTTQADEVGEDVFLVLTSGDWGASVNLDIDFVNVTYQAVNCIPE